MNKQGLGLRTYIPLFLKLLLSVDELLFLHPRLLQRFLICALLMLHLGHDEGGKKGGEEGGERERGRVKEGGRVGGRGREGRVEGRRVCLMSTQ